MIKEKDIKKIVKKKEKQIEYLEWCLDQFKYNIEKDIEDISFKAKDLQELSLDFEKLNDGVNDAKGKIFDQIDGLKMDIKNLEDENYLHELKKEGRLK